MKRILGWTVLVALFVVAGQAMPQETDPLKLNKEAVDPLAPKNELVVPKINPMPMDPKKAPPIKMPMGTLSGSDAPQWPKEILGKKLDAWVADIRDTDPSIRENAIRTVQFFGPDARKAAAKNLIASLDDTDASCRVNAIIMVGLIGFDDPAHARQAVSSLIRLLKYPQTVVRYHAVMALGRLGPEAAAAIGDICTVSMIDQGTWEIRRAAAFAIGRIAAPTDKDKPADRRAYVALAAALSDPSGQVRREVVQSLLILGRPGQPADIDVLKSKILAHALKDKDKTVAIWSRVCLMRLEPGQLNDTNLQALANITKAKDPTWVLQSIQAIGVIGPEAKILIPDLIALLSHDEPVCVMMACWALGRMGKLGDRAIPKLSELAAGKDENIKSSAQEAIDEINGVKKDKDAPKAMVNPNPPPMANPIVVPR